MELQEGIRSFLSSIGQDPDREGLKDTPKRVHRAWSELLSGYNMDPKEILSRTFNEELKRFDLERPITLRNISFVSICEHHLMPFFGEVSITYTPFDDLVGISKLARLVDCFSKRLQLQERLGLEIGQAIIEHLKPLNVRIEIEAQHTCMTLRGAMKPGATLHTVFER